MRLTDSRGHKENTKESRKGNSWHTGKNDKRMRKGIGKFTSIQLKEESRCRLHAPLLVTVNESRRNRADVRAGTNEQKYDQQEGLEVEQRRLPMHGEVVSWVQKESMWKALTMVLSRGWCLRVSALKRQYCQYLVI